MSDQMPDPDEVWLVEIPPSLPMPGGVYMAERMPNDGTRYIRADLYEQAEAERDGLRQQAEGWAQEARAQRATVHECYQACTGATGEPGDWHGAEPVRAVVAERDRLRTALRRVSILLNGNTQLHDVFNAGKIAQEALDHD